MTCSFPTCTRHPLENGYCVSHQGYASAPIEKKRYRIPNRSKSMKEKMKEYKPLVKSFLEKHPLCEIKSPECTVVAVCVHHTKRRGSNLMNEKYFKASCARCNIWVEEHPKEAFEMGHLVSVHKKETNVHPRNNK